MNNAAWSISLQLPDGFFSKLTSHLETAKSQMAAYDADNSIRRIVYIIVNFDDNLHEYADDYSAQIYSFIAANHMPQIEIVFRIKPPFYSASDDAARSDGNWFRQQRSRVKFVRKPRFEAMVRADIDLYCTDQLRAEYHAAKGSYDTLIRLRNSNVSRNDITAEIRWRIHREDCRFWLLATIAFVAAITGCTSVVLAALSRCA
jgi:hypothetical protein